MGCGKKDKDVLAHDNCICKVVRAIKDIQDTVIEEDCECPTSCFNEPLGSLSPATNNPRVNTRVIILKTADGSPFHAFFKRGRGICTSIFFRVEEVFDNCCATLRVLVPGRPGTPSTGGCNRSQNFGDISEDCCISLDELCGNIGLDEGFCATNDCVTVDLSCFCAVQCLVDTFVPGVCE